MGNKVEGVYERIIECAKREFLTKGFKDASLRVIAQNAGTTTGTIYSRFKDKESMFRTIVEPAANHMMDMFKSIQERFHELDRKTQQESMGTYTNQGMHDIIDYIYEHFDEFSLLLDASYGTEFQYFVDELVRIEVDYTYKYMEVIGCESVKSGLVTEEFIHMVVSAYFNGMFEMVRHNMQKEDAVRYMDLLAKYHMAGFDTIFSPEKYGGNAG